MNFTKEVKEIIHLEYDPDDIATDKVAKAITDIHNKQLANIKYLNADDVADVFWNLVDSKGFSKYFNDDDTTEFIQAICKLAIPDIDNEVGEPVTGKPDLCPIETKDIYYSDVMLCSGGGAGIGYKPKVDREKIIEVLNRFLFTDTDNPLEIVSGTATVLTSTGTIADEVIKALEGK